MVSRAKQEARKKTILSIFIIFLMVSSVLGFVAIYNTDTNNTQIIQYNGYIFRFEDNMYVTKINKEDVYFYSPPSTAEFVDLPEEFVLVFKSSPQITFTQDINDTNSDIITALHFELVEGARDKVFPGGFTTNESTRPVIDCSSEGPIMYVHSANVTSTSWDGNCLDLALARSDVIFYRDLLLYHYYGVLV